MCQGRGNEDWEKTEAEGQGDKETRRHGDAKTRGRGDTGTRGKDEEKLEVGGKDKIKD